MIATKRKQLCFTVDGNAKGNYKESLPNIAWHSLWALSAGADRRRGAWHKTGATSVATVMGDDRLGLGVDVSR